MTIPVRTEKQGISSSPHQKRPSPHKPLSATNMRITQVDVSSDDDDSSGSPIGDRAPLLEKKVSVTSSPGEQRDSLDKVMDASPVYIPPPLISHTKEKEDSGKESIESSPTSSDDRKGNTTMPSPSTMGRSSSKTSQTAKSHDRTQRRRRPRRSPEDVVGSKRGSVISVSISKSRRSSLEGVATTKWTNSKEGVAGTAKSVLTSPPAREIYIPLKSTSSSSEHEDAEECDDDGDSMTQSKTSVYSLSGVSALTLPASLEFSPEVNTLSTPHRIRDLDTLIFSPDIHKPPSLPARYMSSDDSQSQQKSPSTEKSVFVSTPVTTGKRSLLKKDPASKPHVGEITPPRHGKRNLSKPTPPLRKRSNDGLVPTIHPSLFRSSTAPANLEDLSLDNSNSLRKWKLEPRKPRRYSDQTPSQRSARTNSSSLERKKPERKNSGGSLSGHRGYRTMDSNGSRDYERGRSERSISARGRRRTVRSERSRSNPRRSITPKRSGRSPSPSINSPKPATKALQDMLDEHLASPVSLSTRRRAFRSDSIELAKGLKPRKNRSTMERSLRSPKFVRQQSPSNRSLSPEQVFEPTYNMGASFTRRSNTTRSSNSRIFHGRLSPKNSSTNSWSQATRTTANCTTSLSSYLDDSPGGHLYNTKSGSQRSRSMSSTLDSVSPHQLQQKQRPPVHPLSSSLSSRAGNLSSRSLMSTNSTSSRPPLASPSISGHSSKNHSLRSLRSSGGSLVSNSSHSNSSSRSREDTARAQEMVKGAISNPNSPSLLPEEYNAKISHHALETISPLSLSSPGSPAVSGRSWKLQRRKFVQERVQKAMDDGSSNYQHHNGTMPLPNFDEELDKEDDLESCTMRSSQHIDYV